MEKRRDIQKTLTLPCGQCIGCRLERSRQWAIRCMHETQLHKQNCFITLTYNDENLPRRNSLDYTEFQKFMKRLRKSAPNRVRFYMCGEYGEENWRPHYHACLFGHDFDDKRYHAKTPTGESLFTSETLEKLWPYGFSTIGAVTFQSAAYVARYCVQKVTGDAAKLHYARKDHEGEYSLRPEFNKMSLKPGIGANWLELYQKDVYPHDYVVVNAKEVKPPKYYDTLYERKQPERMEEIKHARETRARENYQDNTPERLEAKQIVQAARLNQLKRTI